MYARILVPIDGSPTAECGLGEAIRLAQAMRGRIVALTVSAGFVGAMEMASARDYQESSARQLKACTDLVDAAASRARDAGLAVLPLSIWYANARAQRTPRGLVMGFANIVDAREADRLARMLRACLDG